MDPKAEKYYSLSPFNYVANNPLKFIDMEGEDILPTPYLESSRFGKILNKMQSNSLFQKITKIYTDPKTRDNYNVKVTTREHKRSITTNDLKKEFSVIQFASDKFTQNKNEIGLAAKFLHEFKHAEFNASGKFFNQHGKMLEPEMIIEMVQGLGEYVIENNLTKENGESFTLKDIISLSYYNAYGTKDAMSILGVSEKGQKAFTEFINKNFEGKTFQEKEQNYLKYAIKLESKEAK